jgi:GNAT superfamily N-acetyltransferase
LTGHSGAAAGFVRAARSSDADELARVQVACWRDGYTGLVPDDVLASLTGDQAVAVFSSRWEEAITNPPTSRHKVLTGVTGDTRAVVAFAAAGPAGDADRWPGTDAELYELRVQPGLTGQGHGGRLLHAVVDTLVEDGFHTVSTWVLEADTTLRGFLTSAGWAQDGATAELDVGVALPTIRLHTRISALS